SEQDRNPDCRRLRFHLDRTQPQTRRQRGSRGALDKVVTIKRKAQRFVQSGDLAKAIVEFDKLVESGDLEPYDYLQIGDILTRLRRLDDAVLRYRDAVAAYERVGLYKNAIAICKKLLRVRPDAYDILRALGGLYALEGLHTDAIFYYLQYITAAPPDRETPGIQDVGVRLLSMSLPSADVALKIVDVMHAAGCDVAGARPLFDLGIEFEEQGRKEWGQALKGRAAQIVPNVDELEPSRRVASKEDGPIGPTDAMSTFAMSAEEAVFAPPLSIGPKPPEAEPSEHADDEDDSVLTIDTEDGTFSGSGAAGGMAASSGSADPGIDFGMIDLGSPAPATNGNGAGSGAPSANEYLATPFAEEFVPGEPDDLCRQAEERLAEDDLAGALAAWLAAARSAFNFGQSRRAEEIYLQIVGKDPNHLEALQGLTEIAHINGERQKIVRFGCELGDVLLARELYVEAKLEFERVLQFDAGNEKAKSRVARLNSIEGVDKVTARPLAPMASEVQGAMITVRGEPVQTQSVNDLSEILSEFEKAMAAQVPTDDAQSHYDLGMAYIEMGMIEQAIESFTHASASETYQVRALEMVARCQIEAGRPEVAIESVDQALAVGVEEPGREAALMAMRGLALEQIGYPSEAAQEYQRALELDPGLAPAREGILRLGSSGAAA
ncbi:MAG TPA: tetratricopeptide repeat protein, partial [Candidatus Eisenbacteria bacterium]